jgi:hypothetical protein
VPVKQASICSQCSNKNFPPPPRIEYQFQLKRMSFICNEIQTKFEIQDEENRIISMSIIRNVLGVGRIIKFEFMLRGIEIVGMYLKLCSLCSFIVFNLCDRF